MIHHSFSTRVLVATLAGVCSTLATGALNAQAAPPARAVVREATTTDSAALVTRGNAAAPTLSIQREVFAYAESGRRDPYTSLMASGELRPLVSDLRLTAVAYDPNGRNSVAILRDVTSQAQYRVRVGQTLGRLRVSSIRQKGVIFSIDEFGFSRQDTLPLTSDSTTARTR